MEEGYLRELRHDFRAVYHISYDEVPACEAVDLITTLPPGSMYVSATNPYGTWTEERRALADIHDAIIACLRRLGGDRSTIQFPISSRPEDKVRAKMERERVSSARRRIDDTRWEAV